MGHSLLFTRVPLAKCRRMERAAGGMVQAASDWSDDIISTKPFSLTVEKERGS